MSSLRQRGRGCGQVGSVDVYPAAPNLHQRLSLAGPYDEFRELGDTLDGLFDRLEAAFDSQRHFVANASHELRTPLTAERTVLQVALADPAASTAAACAAVSTLGLACDWFTP